MESGSRPRGGVRGITEGTPSIGGEHLNEEGGFRFDNIRYVPDDFYGRMLRGRIRAGDVLVVKDGATTGKVSLVRADFPYPEAVVNEHVFVCRPAEGVLPAFLFWYLFSKNGQNRILDNFQGSAQGGINRRFALGTAVPLAPWTEQGRIVAEVEALLESVNATRARLSNLPAILKRFRQAVVAAAGSGRLSADWRTLSATPNKVLEQIASARAKRFANQGSRRRPRGISGDDHASLLGIRELSESGFPDIPDDWCWVRCADLCQPEKALTYGVIKLGPAVEDGIPTLRSSDIRWMHFKEDGIKRVSPRVASQYSRTFLEGGEVLVTVRGTLGGVAVTPARMKGYNVSREVAVVPVEPMLESAFIAIAVAAEWSQNWLAGVVKGAAYRGVNVQDLRRLLIPVPPVAEQREIVGRVEALFALADRIEVRVRAARIRVERLRQVILARAFQGELVPTEAQVAAEEGREYEPASVLLGRAQELRQQKPTKRGRGGKGMTKRSDGQAAKIRKPLEEVLRKQGKALTPERLFDLAGFDEGTVDEFYEQLRGLIQKGTVREKRSNRKDVTLEAAGA